MTPLDYLAKEYVELTMVKQRYDLDDVYFFVDRPFWKRDSLNFIRSGYPCAGVSGQIT